MTDLGETILHRYTEHLRLQGVSHETLIKALQCCRDSAANTDTEDATDEILLPLMDRLAAWGPSHRHIT